MTALIQLYNCSHQQIVEWVCRTYGIVSTQNYAGTLQAPVSNVAFTKSNIANLNTHRVRREDIARRLRLYRDDGIADIYQLIDQTYTTQEYQTELKKYVKLAIGQNVTGRIIDEIASLYDQPARRKLKDEAMQEKFHADEKRIHLHELLQENQRLMTLCNETLIWSFKGIDGLPKLRIITPDLFDAIPDPRDELEYAGVLVDTMPITVLDQNSRLKLPHWQLWDDKYQYLINAIGQLCNAKGDMVDTPIEHGLGRIPGVILHRREPTTRILDGSHGSDIASAHMAVTLLNCMIIRLSKVQGENQPVIQGNVMAVTTGQVMNGEKPMMLPPDTKASMLQMRTEPNHYIMAKRDIIASVAQRYGMSYEQFAIEETARETSGRAFEVRRIKLTEIRSEARRRAHLNEALIVDLMGYDPTGMKVDHREPSLPTDAVEEIALLADMMQIGIDSPVDYMQRKDPDLHREDAWEKIAQNIEDRGLLVLMLRWLNTPADVMQDVGLSAQQNGAFGQIAKRMMQAKKTLGGGSDMDNTNGGKIQGEVQLRVRSGLASQVVPTGLSSGNPAAVDALATETRGDMTTGPSGRQG